MSSHEFLFFFYQKIYYLKINNNNIRKRQWSVNSAINDRKYLVTHKKYTTLFLGQSFQMRTE